MVGEYGPVQAVSAALQLPRPEGGATVAAGVPQRVSRGDDPDPEVDSEPGASVIVAVTVQSS